MNLNREPLIAYIDGGARGNPGPAGFGVRIEDAGGTLVEEFHESIGVATNNVAEYRGLLAALEWAKAHGYRALHVRSDSLLLVQQMLGNYKVKNAGLQPLHAKARLLAHEIGRVTFEHVGRALNAHADRLANAAMDEARRRSPPPNRRSRRLSTDRRRHPSGGRAVPPIRTEHVGWLAVHRPLTKICACGTPADSSWSRADCLASKNQWPRGGRGTAMASADCTPDATGRALNHRVELRRRRTSLFELAPGRPGPPRNSTTRSPVRSPRADRSARLPKSAASRSTAITGARAARPRHPACTAATTPRRRRSTMRIGTQSAV